MIAELAKEFGPALLAITALVIGAWTIARWNHNGNK